LRQGWVVKLPSVQRWAQWVKQQEPPWGEKAPLSAKTQVLKLAEVADLRTLQEQIRAEALLKLSTWTGT
jgi:hypothetical protein